MRPTISKIKKVAKTYISQFRRLTRFNRLDISKRYKVKILDLDSESYDVFFGYYDISPFNTKKDYLLSCRSLSNNKSDKIEIGFFDLTESKPSFKYLDQTETWCWQMGCRLRWFSDNYICYNKMVNGKYGSVLQDVNSKEIVRFSSYPVYSYNDTLAQAVTLDFSRLERLRQGYGYSNLEDRTFNDPNPKDTGIFIFKPFNSESATLVLSVSEISRFEESEYDDDSEHYINHLSFSPDSKKILFFHVWTMNDKRTKHVRTIVYDIESKTLQLVVREEYIPSHFCWFDNDRLIFALNNGSKGSGYYVVSLDGEIEPIANFQNMLDGHPSYVKNNDLIITDTTPDGFNERNLYIYDFKTSTKHKILSLHNNEKWDADKRCDLHPRVDAANNRICIDTSYHRKRTMAVISFKDTGE